MPDPVTTDPYDFLRSGGEQYQPDTVGDQIYRDTLLGRDAEADDRLRASVNLGLGMEAQRVVRIMQASIRTGLPKDLVERNLDEVERQARASDFDPVKFRRESPIVAEWVARDPQNAALIADDLQTMGVLEGIGAAITSGWRAGRATTERGVIGARALAGGTTQGLEGNIAAADRALASEAFGGNLIQRMTGGTSKILGQMFESIPVIADAAVGGAAAGAATGLIASAPTLGAAAPVTVTGGALAGAATGATAGVWLSAFQTEAGNAYLDMRELRSEDGSSIPDWKTRALSTVVGAVNATLETASFKVAGRFVSDIGRRAVAGIVGEGARRALTRQTIGGSLLAGARSYSMVLGAEVGTELLQEATNIAAEEIGKMTSDGDWDTLVNSAEARAAATERMAGIFQQTLEGMILLAAPGVGGNVIVDAMASRRATRRAEALGQLVQVAGKTTAAKVPDQLASLLRQVIPPNNDGGTMFFQADEFRQVAEGAGVDPAQLATEMGISLEDWQAASEIGGQVSVATADFAAKVGPTQFAQPLGVIARFGADAMSAKDAAAYQQEIDRLMQEAAAEDAAAETPADVQGEATVQTAVAAVRRQVEAHLKRIGMSDRDAKTNAALWGARMRTVAEQAGLTPEQIVGAVPMIIGDQPFSRAEAMIDRLRKGSLPTDREVYGETLVDFLVRSGGLREDQGELAAMDASRARPGLVNAAGMTMDDAARAAAAAGFPTVDETGNYTINALLDALRQDLLDRNVVSPAGLNEQAAMQREELQALAEEIGNLGIDLSVASNAEVLAALDAEMQRQAEEGGIYAQLKAGQEPQGFKTISPFLSPEEKAKLRRDTAGRLVSLFQDLPADADFAEAAKAGQAKRGWYKQSTEAIRVIFGDQDAPRFAALLAAMSPQTSVESNLFNALNTWKNWIAAGRPVDREAILDIMGQSIQGGKGRDSILDAWINNSLRALQAEFAQDVVLSGPKVNSFMLNLRDEVNEVTNDAWMANFALVDQAIFGGSLNAAGTDPGKGPGYLAMAAKVRRVADRLTKETGETWTPAEVQETVWSWAKTAYELAEAAGESRSVEELVREGAVTDAAIATTPDFGTLFTSDASIRSILEAAGYGTAIQSFEAEFGGPAGRDSGATGDAGAVAGGQARPVTPGVLRSARRLDELRRRRRDAAFSLAQPARQVRLPDTIEVDGVQRPTLNSNGQRIAATEEAVRAFWRWFGDSKVVDGEGRPLVVYHGTRRGGFDEFSAREIGTETDEGWYGPGFYFSPDADYAASYASAGPGWSDGPYDPGAAVISAYVKLVNPEITDVAGRNYRKGQDGLMFYEHINYQADGSLLSKPLEIVAVDPSQIKSATGNRGTFDPADPSILRQPARGPRPVLDPAVLDRAAEFFGTTTRLDEAGYVLPDGRMLDFTGRHGVSDPRTRRELTGQRSVDHRQVASVDGVPGDAGEAMDSFIRTGAMRIDFNSGLITIGMPPTPRQVSVIQSIARHHNGAVSIDAMDGRRQFGRYYDEGAKPAKVVGDVRRFYAGEDLQSGGGGFQFFLQAQGAGNAGGFNPFTNVITLFRGRDRSTFLHESAHAWLEMDERIVGMLESSGQMTDQQRQFVADYDARLAWLGVDRATWQSMDLDQRRPYHEKFAGAFEAYLREGKAPSAELRTAFARFKAWLTSIYRSVEEIWRRSGTMSFEMDDTIRALFDRMLATDEAIWQARSVQPEAIIDSPDLRVLADEAAVEAAEELLAEQMKEITAEQEAMIRERRKELNKEVSVEVGDEPVYRALSILRAKDGTELAGDAVSFKLNGDQLKALLGTGTPALRALRGTYSADGGVTLDIAASLLGFANGDALLSALVDAKPKAERVAEIVEERINKEFPRMMDSAEIQEAAQVAMHNARERLLMRETEILAEKVGRRSGGLEGFRESQRVMRAQAERYIAGRTPRQIKPNEYLRAERRAAKEAAEAAKAGDWAGAWRLRQRQLLNAALFRAASAAQKRVKAIKSYMDRVQGPRIQARLGKAGQSYQDRVDTILEGMEFRERTGAWEQRRQRLAAWLSGLTDEQKAAAYDVDTLARLEAQSGTRSYQDVTLADLEEAHDAVRHVVRQAKLKDELLTGQKYRSLKEAITATMGEMDANMAPVKGAKDRALMTWKDKVAKFARSFAADHRMVWSWARIAGGRDTPNGAFWELFVRPVDRAAAEKARMMREDALALKGISDAWAADGRLARDEVRIAGVGVVNREWILAVALNAGNATNIQRLEANGIDSGKLRLILDSLDATDIAYVNGIWNLINSHWSEIAEKERRVNGIVPTKVEAEPMRVRAGTLDGGYYPIVADPDATAGASRKEAQDLVKYQIGTASRATTRRGHLKERGQQGLGPVLLSLDVVPRHLSQVIHDLTHHELIIDLNRVMDDRDMAAALVDKISIDGYRMMEQWRTDIAGGNLSQTATDKIMQRLRGNVSMAAMGYSITTAVIQPTGIGASARVVGWGPLIDAIRTIVGGGATSMQQAHEFAIERSEFMRERLQAGAVREAREVLSEWQGLGKLDRIRKYAFWLTSKLQYSLDLPTWTAAYRTELARLEAAGETGQKAETRAASVADSAVRAAQGSGRESDLNAIQRSKGVVQLFTPFWSYFAVKYNQTAEALAYVRQDVAKNGWTKEAWGRLALDFVHVYGMEAVLSVAIKVGIETLLGGGDSGDDDEDQGGAVRFAQRVGAELISSAMGTVFGLKELTGLVSGYEWRGPSGARAFKDAERLLSEIGEAVSDGDFLDPALFKAIVNAGGGFLGLPASQVNRAIDGILYMEETGSMNPAPILFGKPKQ